MWPDGTPIEQQDLIPGAQRKGTFQGRPAIFTLVKIAVENLRCYSDGSHGWDVTSTEVDIEPIDELFVVAANAGAAGGQLSKKASKALLAECMERS